jgi:hypothetical protein
VSYRDICELNPEANLGRRDNALGRPSPAPSAAAPPCCGLGKRARVLLESAGPILVYDVLRDSNGPEAVRKLKSTLPPPRGILFISGLASASLPDEGFSAKASCIRGAWNSCRNHLPRIHS